MSRTTLSDRILPNYTRREEIFNMVSHIVGGAFGLAALPLCVVFSAIYSDAWAVVASAIYGASLIVLYSMSSIYHGLKVEFAKKVMQVLDHCTIYFLIAGTYTPIVLCAIRKEHPGWGWTMFGIVWGLAVVGIIFAAIDHKRYSKLTMTCYIGMGWCIVIAGKVAIETIPFGGLMWLLAGGIAYTIGAVIYVIGKRRKYMHSVFHIFALIGSILQFVCIFFYIIL